MQLQKDFEQAIALIGKARRQGVSITSDGERLQVKTAKGIQADGQLMEEIRRQKPGLLAFLTSNETLSAPTDAELEIRPRAASGEPLPLSFAQERLWFIDAAEGSVAYHVPTLLRLRGPLNTSIFEQSLQQIIDRHEVLRTTIQEVDGQLAQVIGATGEWKLDRIETIPTGEESLQQHINEYIRRPFDLSKDSLLRVLLIRQADDEHLAVAVMHHIVSDGWSATVIVSELKEIYAARLEGRAPQLRPLPVQYADYALWQKNYLQGEVMDGHAAYWAKKLEGVTPLQLPLDHARPAIRTNTGRTVRFFLGRTETEALQALALEEDATLFMVLITIFNILLYRYTGQTDICVGSPIANRTRNELEPLIGFFVNTLPLRTQVGGTTRTLLHQVRQSLLDAYLHQDMPFEKMVELGVHERDTTHHALFQAMMVLQNQPDMPSLELGNVTLDQLDLPHNTSKFDLTFDVRAEDGGLVFHVEYATELFDAETIDRLSDHFRNLVQSSLSDPDRPVQSLSMLDAGETEQLLQCFNQTEYPLPAYSVIDVFEEGAINNPDEIAVHYNGQEYTFLELDEQAGRIAALLQQKGIGANDLVPVCIERSFQLVAAIVGILKAGAAYVPIDPSYPAERISFMLREAAPRLVLGSTACAPLLRELGHEFVCVDETLPDAGFDSSLRDDMPADRTTYLIYTSGSTGKPKGIEMPDRALWNLLYWQHQTIRRKTGYRILQFASINFDASFQELFLALCFGGTVFLISEEDRLDMPKMFTLLQEQEITHLFIPYVVLKNICEYAAEAQVYPASVEEIFTAGEQLKLTADIHNFFAATGATLYNYYGPSETHVVTACTVDTSMYAQQPLPPIGQPIYNTTVFILDEGGMPCGLGITGELYIGGVQVAKGYLNRPDLISERFISDPFANQAGARLYKTGDRCRWLSNGQIEFLGRQDDQVKIRGYRIELAEVETELAKVPGVRQCVAIAREDGNGSKRLIAYVVSDAGTAFISDHLRSRLPEYMVPSFIVQLPELPLTNNGKVDKRRLPEVDAASLSDTRYTAPRNATEQAIANIWKELLQIEQAGIYDDFFRLGGHSLLATRVLSMIRRKMEATITIREFFTQPTIAALAELALRHTTAVLPSPSRMDRPARVPLSFAQERLWFIDQMEGSSHYHLPAAWRIHGEIDPNTLQTAFRQLLFRHEVLRTVIKTDEAGRGYQQVLPVEGWQLAQVKGSARANLNWRAAAKEVMAAPFNLSGDYMLRVTLLQLKYETIIIVVLHHIAADGWSLSLLMDELMDCYRATLLQSPVELLPLSLQYADYALWQRRHLEGPVLDGQLAYWKTELYDAPVLELPTDHARPTHLGSDGRRWRGSISRDVKDALLDLGRREQVTPFTTLLSAFTVLLYRYTGQKDICIGTTVANRPYPELENLVGLFVNTIVLRTQVNTGAAFTDLLRQSRLTMTGALEHQEAPFEKVVEALGVARDTSRSPIFQVMFEQQEVPDEETLQLGSARLEYEDMEQGRAKFELLFSFKMNNEGIDLHIEYNTDLFTVATIEKMGAHYTQLLSSIAQDPYQVVGMLDLLLPAERQMLSRWQHPSVALPEGATAVSLFEEHARKTPHATALRHDGENMSYAELDEQSNRLAAYLQQRGLEPGQLVMISMQRSTALVVSILAIMKNRAAYVALDPLFPLQRVQELVQRSEAHILLADDSFAYETELSSIASVIQPNDANSIDIDPAYCHPTVQTGDLAYVLYTSGSTGTPKGAMIEHLGMLNHLYCKVNELNITHRSLIAQTASITFDISVWQIFAALICGGTTVICGDELIHHPPALLEEWDREAITIAELVPSYLPLILDERPDLVLINLEYLLVTGETVRPVLLERWFDRFPHTQVVNAYGPTEASDDICHYHMQSAPTAPSVPIGHPVQNMTIYIVNAEGQLCLPGTIGEIWVSGIGVGRGYWKDAERTAKSFGTDPFQQGDVRLYRTGDLGRWLPDGNIEYYGRKDEQVKINGYRIELGEIENVVLQSGTVQQCAVVAREETLGHKRLVAFVVAQEFNQDAIASFVQSRLPAYMLPAAWVSLPALPLLTSGKTDKNSLLRYTMDTVETASIEAPRTEIEQKLAALWASVLRTSTVAVNRNFFEMGGDSILAIQIVIRARKEGLEFQLRDIFEHQTVAELARHIGNLPVRTAEQGLLTGTSGLLPIQQHFFEQDYTHPGHYNQALVIELSKQVPEERLQEAIRQVALQHDALRFSYRQEQNNWIQTYTDRLPQLVVEDISDAPVEILANTIRGIGDYYQKSLHLDAAPLCRFVLLKTNTAIETNRLIVIVHHLMIDGVSWRILLGDLDHCLTAAAKGGEPNMGSKTSSYRAWQQAITRVAAQSNRSEATKLAQLLDKAQDLPYDHADKSVVLMTDIRTHQFALGAGPTDNLLKKAHLAYKTEINELLLAALLQAWSTEKDHHQLTVLMEGHGRESNEAGEDVSNTMGWFTSLYPIFLEAHKDDREVSSLIISVKEQVRAHPAKGIGYGLFRYLHPDADVREQVRLRRPANILFNYLGQIDQKLSESQWMSLANESAGSTNGAYNSQPTPMGINCSVTDGQLRFSWNYSARLFDESTVVQLSEALVRHLVSIVEHCVSAKQATVTPSDFSLAGVVSVEELQSFMNAPSGQNTRGERVTALYPLSPMQNGMLFHGLYDRQSLAYVLQLSCQLKGLEIASFRKSWQELAQRHTILRTGFYNDRFSVPLQAVFNDVTVPFQVIEESIAWSEEEMSDYLNEDRRSGFQFEEAPLLRVMLLRTDAETYKMVWTFHHLIIDGWSLPVLVRELFEIYNSLIDGKAMPEVEEDQFQEYIRYIAARNKEAEEEYWRSYMAPVTRGCVFPFVSGSADRNKGIGKYQLCDLLLDVEATSKLQQFAQQNHITVNTLVQGAWAYVLSNYTDSDDILFGVTVSGRPTDLNQAQKRAGLYINTLPLRAHVDPGLSVSAFLKNLHEEQNEARDFQYTPLSSIQSWQGIRGDLFDSVLVFQNYPVDASLMRQPSLEVSDVQVMEQNNYLLSLIAVLTDRLQVRLKYNSTLLDPFYVAQMRDQLAQVLEQLMTKTTIGELSLLNEGGIERLLTMGHHNSPREENLASFTRMFERQAESVREDTALICRGQKLSFTDLNESANRLARHLVKRGVGPEVPVAVLLERSAELVIAVLAILKAGGAYVPMDPTHPVERITGLMDDLEQPLVLTDTANFLNLPVEIQLCAINLSQPQLWAGEEATNLEHNPSPNDLAYIIYTSGSTGKPKGVLVEHDQFSHYLSFAIRSYTDNAEGPGSYLSLAPTFDASLTSLFVPLATGKCLVMGTGNGIDVFNDEGLPQEAPYDFMKLTPAHLPLLQARMNATLPLAKRLVIGGEALHAQQLAFLQECTHEIEVINEYGPTETTVGCCIYTFDPKHTYTTVDGAVAIGHPAGGCALYVLDRYQQLAPAGVPGELYIGGPQVARGYRNQPELTTERFTASASLPGLRLYKTGDICRWLPNGELLFMGRKDGQVKIKGHRIETGEITYELSKAPGVRSSVVLTADKQGGKRLLAYVQMENGYGVDAVLDHLRTTLPDYMVPSLVLPVEEFPLTAHGKIDLAALAAQEILLQQNTGDEPEMSPLCHELLQFFEELLEVKGLTIHDNLFNVGLDSLKTIEAQSGLNKRWPGKIEVHHLFSHSTIERLSELVQDPGVAEPEAAPELIDF